MATLYILGNGFDIAHGIVWTWPKLGEFIKNKNPDFKDQLDGIYDSKEVSLWGDLERCLANPNMETVRSLDRFFGGFNWSGFIHDLKVLFMRWIQQTAGVTTKGKIFNFSENDVFFSFNYTTTLEDLYEIPEKNILHIHGYMPMSLFNSRGFDIEELIIGHNVPFVRNEHPLITASRKNVDDIIDTHAGKINDLLQGIDKVSVFGCGYSDIDYRYFSYLKNHPCLCTASWEFQWHDEKAKQAMLMYLEKLSIDSARCSNYQQ